MDHAARRDRLRATLAVAGCELLLVTAPNDVRYLTGFSGSNGAVLIGDEAVHDLLVTDARYRERIGTLDIAAVELDRRRTVGRRRRAGDARRSTAPRGRA